MDNWIPKRVLISVVIFILLLPSSLLAKTLRVVLDRDYPPFTYIDKDGHLVGISVDFWKLWEEKTGIDVQLIPVQWAEAFEIIKERSADVIDTIFKTQAREEFLDFTNPLFQMTSSIYYNPSIGKITSLKDLTPYVVGVKEMDALIDVAKAENPSIQFKFYKNYSDIVRSAKNGEIQVFLMDDLPANYYLVKYDLLYEFLKTEPFAFNYLYLATQKGNTEVLSVLNNGLSKFSWEELSKLVKNYTVVLERQPHWVRPLFYTLLALFLILLALIGINRFLARRISQATKELRDKNEELTTLYEELKASNEELEATYEELKASNEELEELYKELEESVNLRLKTFETISKLASLNIEEGDFLEDILKLTLETIPKAKAGSVFLVEEDGNISLVKTKGHSKELEGFVFRKEELLDVDDATVIKNIIDLNREIMPEEKYKTIEMFTRPIKETLVSPLDWEDRKFGYITLDILEDGNHFTETDLNIIRWLSSVIASFYAIRNYVKEERTFLNTIVATLTKALEYYDIYTKGHSERVARYSLKIATRLGLDAETARKIYWAGYLHDIGKIFVPQVILNKNGFLDAEEYEFVKIHPVKSEELISQMESLENIEKIIRHHHERWDGKGYPDGLSRENIPLGSRVLAVADAFDAMTTERPYRRALTLQEAIEELRRCSGSQFDPKIAEVMILIIQEELIL
ncbi:transporter substrate-binding domain-containing protein [bacterium]|nr:transporter substrate-binding domain-containing protein [bacterium]